MLKFLYVLTSESSRWDTLPPVWDVRRARFLGPEEEPSPGWGRKRIDRGVGSLTDVDHTSEIDVAGIVFTIREEQNDISAGGVIRFPELI